MPEGWLPDCGFGDDAPRVRRPTCRCVYGRPPLLASAADQDEEDETDDGLCAPPPPQWKPTKETLDLEALIAADGRAPLFEESVDLWRDDLDPHSFGFFRVRVRAHERFWVAYSRFFIRVNGVRARVIDARFAGFGDRVLRERSWREGDWTAVAGAGAPPCVDLGGLLRRPANTSRFHAIDATPRRKKREDQTTKTHAGAGDRHCARALPLVKRETDELRLPATLLRRAPAPPAAVAWSRGGGSTLVATTAHVAVLVDDASIAAVDAATGTDRWTRRKVAATALAASDEYVAVGFDDGRVEVRAAAGGALAATVDLGEGSCCSLRERRDASCCSLRERARS